MKTIFSFNAKVQEYTHIYTRSEKLLLMNVVDGCGDFFIGDNVVSFNKGDVFFFRGNLASDVQKEGMHSTQNGQTPDVVLVYFDLRQLSEGLKNMPEAYYVRKLMTYSEFGLKLASGSRDIAKEIARLKEASNLHKTLWAYSLMDKIARNKDVVVLSAKASIKREYEHEGAKIKNIFDYIKQNHRERISLEQISAIANMSPTGFCRFFKSYEKKTFTQYLAELRIESACNMLKDPGNSISDCCYESGFNNLSNFNRHFKKNRGMSPSEYRKMVMTHFVA